MATYTTNLNLKKPATSDKIRIADFNNNADLIDAGYGAQDTSMGKLGGGLAIISTGNVHAAISAGDYVYVRKHGTLAEGLYTADSAISANGTLSSSNVTAVSGGGLNALKKIETYTGADGTIIYKNGRTAQLAVLPTVSTTADNAVVSTISDSHFRPSSRVWMTTKVFNGSTYTDCFIELATNGNISIKRNDGTTIAGYQANYTQCLGLQYFCNG